MGAQFKIYTGMLRAYEVKGADGTSRKKFKTTASSTIKDLAGDEIQYPAIEKMASKARDNMTIFLNHSYNVPEDVLGSCEDAQVIRRGIDADGNDIIDLDFDIGVNEVNPRAIQAWESINSGVKLGTSIGAIVRHATKKKGGGLLIDDVELLEASLVGIPANPRSWVQYAVKGLSQVEDPIIDEEVDEDFEITQAGEPEKTDGTVNVAIHIDANDGPHVVTETDNSVDNSVETSPGENEVENEVEASVTPDLTKTDDELAKARVVVTVDGDSAQEAPKSDPGTALMDEDRGDTPSEPDNSELGDGLTLGIATIVEKYTLLTERYSEAIGQVDSLTKELSEVRTERDEALANLDLAKQLFERIEHLPLRRKTAPVPTDAPVKEYSKFAGYLDAEVIKLLEKK